MSLWFEREWKVGGGPMVKLWFGEPPVNEGNDETPRDIRPPDLVVSKFEVDGFVVEYMRGPAGPVGPMGPMGPPGG